MKSNLFIGLFSLFIVSTTGAQDLSSGKNAVITMMTAIDLELFDALDPIEPETTKERSKYTESKDFIKQIAMDACYQKVGEALAGKGINVQPLESIADYISIGPNGYPHSLIPKSTIKKMFKKGYEGDYFFVFNLFVQKQEVKMKNLLKSAKVAMKEGLFVLPDLDLEINVFGSDGKKVKSHRHSISSEEKIFAEKFQEGKFDKLEKSFMEELWSNIDPILDEAIAEVVAQF